MSKGAFVLVAPNSMAFRAIANSQVLPLLHKDATKLGYERVIVLSPDDGSQQQLPDYIEWRSFLLPAEHLNHLPPHQKVIRAVTTRLSRYLGFGFENTVFRFNQLQQFFAHKFKQGMSLERRQREELAGNFVSKKYGFPFPNSKALYNWIYNFHYSKNHVTDPNIQAFFKENKIDKLVFWHVQNSVFREFSICARKQKIPYIAVIGSWDRPTTKGPICPNCDKYIVNSVVMKNELEQHHEIDSGLIEVVGWPQMDVYHDPQMIEPREEFLSTLNINTNDTVLLYAGNAARLGAHEPSLVEHIARQINHGNYGGNIHLLIRPHPQDVDWQERYAKVSGQEMGKHVTLMPAEMGNMKTMVNTLQHADIVMATQGSISLDAAALDKKIINIAFNGTLKRSYTESVERWYEMDHYLPVVNSGGVAIVNSFDELDSTVTLLLAEDPQQKGRQHLRNIELEPFKGDSSARQVQAMLS